MAINPEIRDQAYQFFIEEAPELLQAIEDGLLTIKQEKSTANVHHLMRLAHSIKGGSASVELDVIATIAHRLENIFKALYGDELEIDTDVESQLLQAYDCLRLPLMEQIQTGEFDIDQALALAEPIFAQLEERFADALSQADTYIPSSADLGVDMTRSVFEVDVAQGLERLVAVVANPQDYEVTGEIRAQAEVFAGFAEFLNLPGFGAIAQTTLTALNIHPERALEITQLALADFQIARDIILGHVAGSSIEIRPTPALVALADSTEPLVETSLPSPTPELSVEEEDDSIFSIFDLSADELDDNISSPLEPSAEELEESIPSLEAIFGSPSTLFDHPISSGEWDYTSTTAAEMQEEELDENLLILGSGDEIAALVSRQNHEEAIALRCPKGAIAPETDTEEIIEVEWATTLGATEEEATEEIPTLEEVFGSDLVALDTEAPTSSAIVPISASYALQHQQTEAPETLEIAVQQIEHIFESLPAIDSREMIPQALADNPIQTSEDSTTIDAAPSSKSDVSPTPNLTVRVDLERLGRMNNVVGELAINRNGLSLQNEQLQGSVRELLNRFSRVQNQVGQLQNLSDQMLVSPERYKPGLLPRSADQLRNLRMTRADFDDFDSLELDNYGVVYSQLQGLLEEMMQLEESVDDIVLFAKATDQTLERQRQMLTQLRDELMWARMLPLGEVLNRFPRMLRDLSTAYHKPINLKLSGTGVLVDKAVLEKLFDPLLHLIRNAFDHGIEFPEVRRQRGKPEAGFIEIRAYHRGSQTIIEVKDDGQGLNLERIRQRALELGLLSPEQLTTTPTNRLFNLIFEPGFSTALEVSELSGRGVGLDVVRSQLRSLKGTITVSSQPEVGTTFTLRLPLTLTIAKLLVCFNGSTALALPSDSIEEIVIPKTEQIKHSGTQRFLHWREEIIPTYRLTDLLDYACHLPETSPTRALLAVPTPESWALPMLVLRQEQNVLALEVDRLVTEQELVIKPFSSAIAPPSSTYGCTILGDGSVIPVIDATVLVDQLLTRSAAATATTTGLHGEMITSESASQEKSSLNKRLNPVKGVKSSTVLVVDDAVALRRTLALSLERAGMRVLQARDGREALERLHQSSSVKLVICDIEMPNMNGFEFLSHRRQDTQISKIPVVMLTSRSNDKHRWLAMQLGANAYFTKPYLEQEFLLAIKQLMGERTLEQIPV